MHKGYRRPDSTCGVSPTLAHCFRCASCRSHSPENAIYLAGTGRAGPNLYGSNAVSCGSEGGRLTQEKTVFKDFHLQWKIEYKSGFIGLILSVLLRVKVVTSDRPMRGDYDSP